MANEKNLIPFNERTESEQREIQSKGGKMSGETRRKKKLLKDCMQELLDLPVANTKQWNKLSKMGINVEEIDNRTLLTVALFSKAVETGDVSAFKEIRNLIDEDANKDLSKLDDVLDKIEGNV